MKYLQILSILILLLSCESSRTVTLEKIDSPTGALLQAISFVDENTIWASGHQATFVRTRDRGRTWKIFGHPTADTLQFRDLHAFNADHVALMSAGPGASSRIFIFSEKNGWKETYVMPFPEGFLNTIEFWDDENGLAFGDSFHGEIFVLKTKDGGNTWTRLDPATLPPAGIGEGGFAASGTCISMQPGGKAWIATGASGNSRILFTEDFGGQWKSYDVPTVKGEMAGIFSIRMADEAGTITGGDLADNEGYMDNLAITEDAGKNWKLVSHPVTKGTFYGSDFLKINGQPFWIISSPGGIDYSFDKGQSWQNLDTLNYWAVDIHPSGYGFAVGSEGNISKITVDL